MTAGGKKKPHISARDTVFAAVMLILNGVLGLSLLVGSVKFHKQFFARTCHLPFFLIAFLSAYSYSS